MWGECNCVVYEHSLALSFFRIDMNTDLFQSCGHCWVFQICWHIECSTFTASSFRIWNRSPGIPSPPLALFTVMFPRPTWPHIPGCLALGEWSNHPDYLGHEDLFVQFRIFLPPLLNIFCFHLVHTICPLLSPSLHEMFPWCLLFSWGDL